MINAMCLQPHKETSKENNTDAEGRLTLAGALVYACREGVDFYEWVKISLTQMVDSSLMLIQILVT